jgi:hypothetical protein
MTNLWQFTVGDDIMQDHQTVSSKVAVVRLAEDQDDKICLQTNVRPKKGSRKVSFDGMEVEHDWSYQNS